MKKSLLLVLIAMMGLLTTAFAFDGKEITWTMPEGIYIKGADKTIQAQPGTVLTVIDAYGNSRLIYVTPAGTGAE